MAGDRNWRVEEWTQGGNPTGYRIVRGFGAGLEVYRGYTGNIYRDRSFEEARALAEALCAELNDEIVHNDFLEFPNGRGFIPCSEPYRILLEIRDGICNINAGENIEDLSAEDYQRWSGLDDFLGSMHLNGHIGKAEFV
jgi:hypothetical protein